MPSGAKKRKAAKRKQQQQHDHQMGIPHPPPDSPPNPPPSQENNGIDIHDPASHDESSDEESVEENKEDPAAMASAENGKGVPVDVAIGSKELEALPSSSSLLPASGTEEVSPKEVEPTEIELDKLVPNVSVVPIIQSDPATEEVQSTEAAVDTFEAAVDALTHEGEAKTLSIADTVIEQLCEAETPAAAVAIETCEAETHETTTNTEPCEVEITESTPASTMQPHNVEISESTVIIEPRERETPDMATEVTPASLMQHRATWWNCCGLFDVFGQR